MVTICARRVPLLLCILLLGGMDGGYSYASRQLTLSDASSPARSAGGLEARDSAAPATGNVVSARLAKAQAKMKERLTKAVGSAAAGKKMTSIKSSMSTSAQRSGCPGKPPCSGRGTCDSSR